MRFQAQRGSKGKGLPFPTSILDRDGWSTARLGRFISGKMLRYAIYRRLGGPQGLSGRVWREENIPHPPGFEPRTVQSLAGRYTDYDILDPQPACIVWQQPHEHSKLSSTTPSIGILSKLIEADRSYWLKDDLLMTNSAPCHLENRIQIQGRLPGYGAWNTQK